jgi:hypothetical protein
MLVAESARRPGSGSGYPGLRRRSSRSHPDTSGCTCGIRRKRRWNRSRRTGRTWSAAAQSTSAAARWGNGSGRSSSVFTTLKTATLAPMPSARISTATTVNPDRGPASAEGEYFSPATECRVSSVLAPPMLSFANPCRQSAPAPAAAPRRTQPAAHILFDRHLKVRGHLRFKVRVEDGLVEEGPHARSISH